MANFARHIVFAVIVGALFGWALSTKFSTLHAVGGGAAAAAFVYGGSVYSSRVDRREAHRRREDARDA